MIYVIALRDVAPLGFNSKDNNKHVLVRGRVYKVEKISHEGNYFISDPEGTCWYYDPSAFRELTNVERLVRGFY